MASVPRRRLPLILGVVLVTVPIWTPVLDITGREHQYRSAPVTVENNRIQVVGDTPRLGAVEHVDCFHAHMPSRQCGFESHLINRSPVQAPYPGVRHVSGEPSLHASEQYVAFADDGRLFRRTTGWNDSAQAYVLRLERVNATKVLAEIVRPASSYRPPIRRAVEDGSAWAEESLSEAALVSSSDGRYYVVYETRTRSFLSEKPVTERVFELLAVSIGILLILRASEQSEVP